MTRMIRLAVVLCVGILPAIENAALLAQEKSQSPAASKSSSVKNIQPPGLSQQNDGAVKFQRTGSAATSGSSTDAGAFDPAAAIREPSQGHPIFITPGDTFYFVMNLPPRFKGDVGFSLRNVMEPGVRIPLRAKTPPSFVNNDYFSLVLEVRKDTAAGLYDLVVQTKDETYSSRHSVKIIDAFRDQFRFVHLSDMNIGDSTAPEFDDRLAREINLLAPEFIIATGNYTEWARALDDASSWRRILNYFEKFHAPVFMLCGLHDHEASFTRYVASNPIATLDYGNYHGLLLLDHPGHPIDQDYSQLQWVDADLRRHRQKRMNFIVANSDELGLIDVWRERGKIQQFISEHKVRMFITGGASDWDYREFADKLKGLKDFHFIRTHESSTALCGRATGFSHYRVIEVDGDQVSYVYPDDTAAERLQYSIPTGRLRAYFDAPNDGTAGRVGVTVQNALNQGFKNAHLWLRVAKNGSNSKPTVAAGHLDQLLDVGTYWACDVGFDLPDKGAVRIVASMTPADIPDPEPIDVALNGPDDWSFVPHTTGFGMSYFESRARVVLNLSNRSETERTCWPVIRANGSKLTPDPGVVKRLPLTLKPKETLSIPLVLNLRRVSPGRHTVQVYFLEDTIQRLHTFDVNFTFQEALSSSKEESSSRAGG